MLATHHFDSAEALETILKRYVWLYNHHLTQKALGHKTPVKTMKSWYAKRPDLFNRKPRNHPGPDNYPRQRGWAVVLLLAAVLIVSEYHFLGDVIAGTYIGYLAFVAARELSGTNPKR